MTTEPAKNETDEAELAKAKAALAKAEASESRYRQLSGTWRMVLILLTSLALLLALNQMLNLHLTGSAILSNSYLYALCALLTGAAFLLMPAGPNAPRDRVPWYDALMFVVLFAVFMFFSLHGQRIAEQGWEYNPPTHVVWIAAVGWVLLLEALRRAGGTAVFVVVTLFSIYPIVAGVMPGPISGFPQDIPTTTAYHFASSEGVVGIPTQAFGELVIGFVMFGAALQFTGAARFFNNIAFALFGGVRGGPAKVAIFASGLMGSVSGSVVSNVLTTGVVTIPAMKRTGFKPAYAGGVEACASTGGVLMPPVMGATAFVMASFLGMPYAAIVVAAVIPSLLYYFGLFVQIDGYAARHGLRGLPREDLPSIKATFAEGWHYILVFIVLIWMLLVLQREAMAPFYATAVLLVINQFSKRDRLDFKKLGNLLVGIGSALVELSALLAGVGLIIGALSVTGLAGTLANDLVFLAGNNVYILLVMGALTSFIFGMGMTITACYIFLAIVLAPSLISAGFDPLAVHLFMMYWGMVSFITPPVALGAFVAAGIAGAAPMKVGFASVKLGATMYIVPFLFVLNPALIFNGSAYDITWAIITAFIGIYLAGCALEGYLGGVGDFRRSPIGWLARLVLAAGGILLAMPGGGEHIQYSHIQLTTGGLALAAIAVLMVRATRRPEPVAT
ncbi:MAG: TRAP transporter fused permease subunit [Pseudomonadota bacterium]|jgi:TRAP transporter 4TM/12TM fusion protein|nr:TRAP transporter fused permease subunit [Pseudomonadota bacterium]